MRLQDNKHRELLEEIVNILIERSEANLRTTIGKVKAHIGIHGNEQADKGAVRASRLETGHDITVDIGRHPYVDHYWPTYNETIDTDTGPQVKLQQVSDLKAGLKSKLHPICRLGYTKETSHTRYWRDICKEALGNISNTFWTSAKTPFSALRNVLQYRAGVLYSEKLAMRYGKSYTGGKCPMCQKPDSAGHILGGCLHQYPKL